MRTLLAPISWIYSLIVRVRNWLFDENILRSWTVDVPTICVGNLSIGGAGKTPHVAYLAQMLSEHYKVAVLSRGYKRKSSGFILADENSTIEQLGDEAYQLHKSLPDVVVAVSEHRVRGVNHLMSLRPDVQVVVLDDGFQHRRIRCGFYLLLTTHDKLYVNDHILPWGNLREHADSSLRANAVVVTKCPEDMQPIDRRVITSSLKLPPYIPLYFSSIAYGELHPVFDDVAPLDTNMQLRPLLVTGIAHPEYLIQHLKEKGIEPRILSFSDHHWFSKSDIEKIQATYKRYFCNCIFTTEKDAVRFQNCNYMIDSIKQHLYAIPIKIDLQTQEKNFQNQIINYVEQNSRNR